MTNTLRFNKSFLLDTYCKLRIWLEMQTQPNLQKTTKGCGEILKFRKFALKKGAVHKTTYCTFGGGRLQTWK